MATTPPHGRRLHTPPGPLHGPQHDTYQPYSPRRSSRISAQSSKHTSLSSASPGVNESTKTSPQHRRKPTLARTTSQTFSPPSSPDPSPQRTSPRFAKHGNGLNVLDARRNGKSASLTGVGSDSEAFGTTPVSKKRSRMESLGMLPTPSKTPRKSHATTAVNATARVLFPNRPTAGEDLMPTPRRQRMARNHDIGGLDGSRDGRSGKIEIFQDSRDKVPDAEEKDDNPFVGRRGRVTRGSARSNGEFSRRGKAVAHEGKRSQVEEAIEQDEGMVYVFRGKKVFRKFKELRVPTSDGEDADLVSDNDSLLRRAGAAVTHPTRPFTHSSITPRLLFPSKDQVSARQQPGPDDVGEEDVTDIDESRIAPFPTKFDEANHVTTDEEQEDQDHPTPAQELPSYRPVTPPPTARKTRARARKGTPGTNSSTPTPPEPVEYAPQPKTRGKRTTPFDAWQRTKPGAGGVSKGTKREGDVLQREGGEGDTASGKRMRSGAF